MSAAFNLANVIVAAGSTLRVFNVPSVTGVIVTGAGASLRVGAPGLFGVGTIAGVDVEVGSTGLVIEDRSRAVLGAMATDNSPVSAVRIGRFSSILRTTGTTWTAASTCSGAYVDFTGPGAFTGVKAWLATQAAATVRLGAGLGTVLATTLPASNTTTLVAAN